MAKIEPKTILTKRGFAIVKSKFTNEELSKIKKDLTVTPFSPSDFGPPPSAFPIYLESPLKLYLPKHYAFESLGEPEQVKLSEGLEINLEFKGSLRPQQLEVIDKFMKSCETTDLMDYSKKSRGGLICVGCGFGKTVMGLNLISRLKRKTLVIVHKEFLVNQWKKRIEEYLPSAKVGTIQGPIIDYKDKDIVIGMLQSLSMKEYDDSIFNEFGFSIVDECFPYEQLIITNKGRIPIGILFELYWFVQHLKNNGFDDITTNYLEIPKILTYNELTKKYEYKSIVFASKHRKNNLVKLVLYQYDCFSANSYDEVISTDNHKFLTEFGWLTADKIQIGQKIVSINNRTVEVVSKEYINPIKPLDVFDLEIEENHNFIVCNSNLGVVAHNCHHIAAEVFSRALPKINSMYQLGLSATPKRPDGLSKVFHWFLGPIIYEAKKINSTNVEVMAVHYHNNWDPGYNKEEMMGFNKVCPVKMISNIVIYDRRNALIARIVMKLVLEGRKTLILSERRDHLVAIENLIKDFTTVGYYVGGMKQKDLDASEEKQVLLATYQMASEGMDIPSLDSVIFATPKSSIEQSIGRITRKVHDNPPIAYDIVDEFSIFPNQFKKRKTVYNKLKYKITHLHIKDHIHTTLEQLTNQIEAEVLTEEQMEELIENEMKKEEAKFKTCLLED